MEVAKILKQGTLALTSHTAHRSAVATIAAGLEGHGATPSEGEPISEAAIANHRRPVEAVATNAERPIDPVPTIHEIRWRGLNIARSATNEAKSCDKVGVRLVATVGW